MTIQQVITKLQEEKQNNLPSRYPCRAVMVKNVEQYCQLLSELKKISDIRVVQSSEIFSSFDVMPKYDNLKAPVYRNEWVILTGVSEYLRLFSKKEAMDRRFASLWSYQAPASSTGRIIIPLWGCEAQWFDPAINLSSDLRQEDFYFDCVDSSDHDQTMSLLVLSGMFEQHIGKLESIQGSLKVGLQDWFEYWENPAPDVDNFVLLTKRFNSISVTSGNISVDRFHGFIPGWEIPRMTTGLIAKGWAINTEYFAEVLHELRSDLSYAAIVEEMIDYKSNADKRDLTAIKRLCTAFMKLLFPHVQSRDDISQEDFDRYCLQPALEMRGVIKKQLCIIDPKEFDVPGKNRIPEVTYKE